MTAENNLVIISDKDILNAVRSGENRQVLSSLYKIIYPKIKRYIVQNNGSAEDAEDIFQNGVLIFYKHVKLNKFKENYEIGGFIYTVCKNLWIKQVKKKGKHISISDKEMKFPSGDDTFADIVSEERSVIVQKLFEQLSDRCREILYYSFYMEFTPQEIMKLTGLANEDAVKTKKYKCKKKLVEYVKKHPDFKNYFED